ncbi:hypothetical protein Psal006b_02000 [Piscirickettsia salmonis]|uniref:Membrane protein n=1 Tax=Piscirickettsia salmonis TaxID=1238 RepID=A0A1L6TAU9_PISSA|nr:hypothetical protein [Piscirickettsia salmonis]AKP73623.1 hypothetical protein PSLF89_1798 [Piscirickettsia salmonis LF-89 = ATCC VR-1361]ALB22394.1 membrane protein [Piscirickettsia salmonis]ALY02468.1 hypothetical protein AWE47_06055 [Piscirickettsia salmonis]AMA41987.1 hypothetical protein AWJ11_06080 [Piscirickettsia salmonis]AOS34459.1 hypothetical protein AVM72_03255 [Piscirickettsia salmonis]
MKQKRQLRLLTLITCIIAWLPVIICGAEYFFLTEHALAKKSTIAVSLFITAPNALFSTFLCFVFYLIAAPSNQSTLMHYLILWVPTAVTTVSWLSHTLSTNPSATLTQTLTLYLAITASLLSIALRLIRYMNHDKKQH